MQHFFFQCADCDGFGNYEAASTTSVDYLDLELKYNLQDRSNRKANDWLRERGLDKITSRHPDGSRFLSVRRLFNQTARAFLARQTKMLVINLLNQLAWVFLAEQTETMVISLPNQLM